LATFYFCLTTLQILEINIFKDSIDIDDPFLKIFNVLICLELNLIQKQVTVKDKFLIKRIISNISIKLKKCC